MLKLKDYEVRNFFETIDRIRNTPRDTGTDSLYGKQCMLPEPQKPVVINSFDTRYPYNHKRLPVP